MLEILNDIIFERGDFESVANVFEFAKLVLSSVWLYLTALQDKAVFEDNVWLDLTVFKNDGSGNSCI